MIVSTLNTQSQVVIRLANGVAITIADNDDHVHMAFSGINGQITCCGPCTLGEDPKHELDLSNYVNIHFRPA